ncbi:MAG TPA: squalene synthase HpnC [Streptosporangiaceae bacterium]
MAGHTSGTEPAPAHARTQAAPPLARSPARTADDVSLSAAAQASAENFPVALRILPARYRRHLMALYGFARLTDDIGDEVSPEVRLRLLDELEADVRRCYGGGSPQLAARWEPALRELAVTVAQCDIPAQPLLDLIQANRQDQLVTRYETFEDLAGYCRLSANPVGRVVLHIFGAASPVREQLSDSICTALQLAEHWQDVAEDLGKGRIYLPRADRDKFGVSERDLAAPVTGRQVRALIAYEVARASALLDEGAPLVGTLRGAARVAVAGYLAGGRAALAAITASGHDVLAVTPRPDHRVTARLAIQAYLRGR